MKGLRRFESEHATPTGASRHLPRKRGRNERDTASATPPALRATSPASGGGMKDNARRESAASGASRHLPRRWRARRERQSTKPTNNPASPYTSSDVSGAVGDLRGAAVRDHEVARAEREPALPRDVGADARAHAEPAEPRAELCGFVVGVVLLRVRERIRLRGGRRNRARTRRAERSRPLSPARDRAGTGGSRATAGSFPRACATRRSRRARSSTSTRRRARPGAPRDPRPPRPAQ